MFAVAQPFSQTVFFPQTLSRTPPCSVHDVNFTVLDRNYGQSMSNELSSKLEPRRNNSSPLTSPAPPSTPLSSDYAKRYAQLIRQPTTKVAERSSRQTRRDAFLDRVKHNRDTNKFEARSGQIQRSDFLEQRQRFEMEMARTAPQFEIMEENEEHSMDSEWHSGKNEDNDEVLLEDFIAEERDYEAFLESLQRQDGKEDYSSETRVLDEEMEDEDDSLLAEILTHFESQSQEQMDTSGS